MGKVRLIKKSLTSKDDGPLGSQSQLSFVCIRNPCKNENQSGH